MEIEEGCKIYFEIKEASKKLSDNTDSVSLTKKWDDLMKQKWVAVDDLIKWINELRKSNKMFQFTTDELFSSLEEELEGKC